MRVYIEDLSKRVPKRFREWLFTPFHQQPLDAVSEEPNIGRHFPLFLSRMLVEVTLNGTLEDQSDQMESKIGNRFVFNLPKDVGIASNPESF